MKKIMSLAILIIALFGNSCQIDLGGNVDLTTDTKSEGWITGRVVIPSIDKNKLVWNGLSGVTVSITRTNYSTVTATSGEFSFDEIPTGTYDVTFNKDVFTSNMTSTVTVRRQQESDMGDITLYNYDTYIVYGILYNEDKNTPAGRVQLDLIRYYHGSPLEVELSTITNSTGEFGFTLGGGASITFYGLRANNKKNVKWLDSNAESIKIDSKIMNQDAYIIN